MAIEQSVIDEVKRSTDLVALVRSRGIELKKNGRGFIGLCPFHNDTNPSLSVNPTDNLWQCFGCGTAGDAIRFVELIDKVSFPEAVEKLTGSPIKPKTKTTTNEKPKPTLTVKERKLLARVVSYYQHTLTQDRRGLTYLQQTRGITDPQTLKDFGTGYANGTLKEILPAADPSSSGEDPETIQSLKKIGILTAKGREAFSGCVTFPLYNTRGQVVNLYGRKIDDTARTRHLYLPGERAGLVNRQAARRADTVILAEAIIDAITLYDQGFKNVIPIYGTNGLTPDHLSFFNRRLKTAYLAFDADEAGIRAAEKTARQLKEKGITCHTVRLPVKDVNLYFKRHTPEQFEQLLTSANPKSLEHSDKVNPREQRLYKENPHGFTTRYGDRQYEVKGIQRGDTQLKVTIKAQPQGSDTANTLFELTTIDLYSSRSRVWFARLCADLFSQAEELVKEDLGRLLTLVEGFNPNRKETATEPTPDQKRRALRFLKSKQMFREILTDMETLGITGEETNKLVGYLAAISRKTDEPLSVLIQSRSAAGKSTLQDAVLSLVPEEDFVKYTRITDQALFYKDEDSLVHKILAIEEEMGMGGAAYSVRNIQSSKKITVAATGKDPGTGKMKTEEYTVKGPVAVMITTTAAQVEGETASRFLFLTIDESTKMTQAIHKMQREAETLEGLVRRKKGDALIAKHHTAQRLLKSVAVVNPFTPYLTYADNTIRTRRDHKKYLGLIRTIAFLHQYQRKTKAVTVEGKKVSYIEVTLKDIDAANRLADQVLGQCLDEVAPPSRTLLRGIYRMVKEQAAKQKCSVEEVYFTRRQVREHLGWTDWQIKAHIKQLEELEYLSVRVGHRGKEYSYALNYRGQGEDKQRFYLNLTSVDQIKKRMQKEKKSTPN